MMNWEIFATNSEFTICSIVNEDRKDRIATLWF